MKEAFGHTWKRDFAEGEEIIPEDLDAPIPELFKESERPPLHKTIYRDPQDIRALSKRDFLKKAFETGLAVTAAAVAPSLLLEKHSTQSELKGSEKEKNERHATGRIVHIETGKLAGRKVGSLFALYLGLTPGSKVPNVLEVDFSRVLDNLWQQKIDFVHTKIKKMKERGESAEKIKKVEERIPNLLQAKKEITNSYADKWKDETVESLTLSDMVAAADSCVKDINKELNWNELNSESGPFRRLSNNAIQVVQHMAEQVDGRMIVAYSLTELMPALTDSEMNADEYEFLLKHAGAEFLLSTPALYDHWLSFGLLQFTSLALRDDGEKTEGASHINKYLPTDKKIENSVKYATSLESQLKAGHLFAIYNLASLVQSILKEKNENEKIHMLKVLIQQIPHSKKGLVQFIASAHHSPGHARTAYKKWLQVGMKGKHSIHADAELAPYIKKSGGNYDELVKRVEKV